jgi:uncharacterized DUF497 family protein
VRIDFEWDPGKARLNAGKHGVSFELAATVFRDPGAVSVFDGPHSRREDRWLTLGIASNGGLLVVHHTFEETDENRARVRIISSRRATKTKAGSTGREPMKKEYDFSGGVKGRFHRPGAALNIPVYLDDEVRLFVQKIADKRSARFSETVNLLLRSEMHLADAVTGRDSGRAAEASRGAALAE